jgi:hypothetical protein
MTNNFSFIVFYDDGDVENQIIVHAPTGQIAKIKAKTYWENEIFDQSGEKTRLNIKYFDFVESEVVK